MKIPQGENPVQRLDQAFTKTLEILGKQESFIDREKDALRSGLTVILGQERTKFKLLARQIRATLHICLSSLWNPHGIRARGFQHSHPIKRSQEIGDLPKALENLKVALNFREDGLLPREQGELEDFLPKAFQQLRELQLTLLKNAASDAEHDPHRTDDLLDLADADMVELRPKKPATAYEKKPTYHNTSSGSGRNRQARMR